jgi:RimJ/RimL family protein N-acetyltransferase
MIGPSLYTSENIRLTAVDPEKDAAALSTWTDQHGFDRRFNYGLYRFIPEPEMKKMLEDKFKKAGEYFCQIYFAVRKKNEEGMIGFARIVDVYAANQAGSVYIDFGKKDDLLQYGSETLRLMMRYAFMEISLYRLQTSFSAYEGDLIALYERFGFLRDVRRREAVFHAGRHWDSMIYSMLRSEYLQTLEKEAK